MFGKAKGTISEHIKHIFEDGELTPAATVRLFRTVQSEGARDVAREVEHYNLGMVLALGFRVRSPVGVRFRQWANDNLKESLVKGFVLDEERLKNPGKGRETDSPPARHPHQRAALLPEDHWHLPFIWPIKNLACGYMEFFASSASQRAYVVARVLVMPVASACNACTWVGLLR